MLNNKSALFFGGRGVVNYAIEITQRNLASKGRDFALMKLARVKVFQNLTAP